MVLLLALVACTGGPSSDGPAVADARVDSGAGDTADVFPTRRDAVDWPFATDSPWNWPLGDAAALAVPDAPCTRSLREPSAEAWINAEKWSHPIFRAAADDPARTIWADGEFATTIPMPAAATPALPPWPDTDAHLHIIDPTGGWVDETWRAHQRDDGDWDVDSWARVDLYGSGIGSGGVRVYGGSAIAGLIRPGEVDTGIHHALALALALDELGPTYTWPASELSTSRIDEYTGAVATGQLVALPPDLDVTAQGWSPAGVAVARALQRYGAYVTDHASGFALYASPEAEDAIDPARDDLDAIRSQLRCVTDNAEATPGGAGTRLAPEAPELDGR